MTRLIAGAGGVLGRELVRQALTRGDHVVALVLRKGELRVIEHPHLRIIEADVTKPEQLHGICTGIDQVVSCIGITRLQGKLTHEIVDYRGNLNLLAEAQRAGVRRFGFISPAGTEQGCGHAPLIDAKVRFEQALQASGMPWVIFRSGGFFPDIADMLKLAAKGPLYAIGDGNSRSTPIHIPDLARIMLAELDRPDNAIVEVGGPQDLTWRETCATCFGALGRPARLYCAPLWLCRLTLGLLRPFSYRYWAMGRLLLFMAVRDVCTPKRGTLTLREYLAGVASPT
jgi:uncharacterized protein YbjT (DUF2867 family)